MFSSLYYGQHSRSSCLIFQKKDELVVLIVVLCLAGFFCWAAGLLLPLLLPRSARSRAVRSVLGSRGFVLLSAAAGFWLVAAFPPHPTLLLESLR